jgi:hypothetical protein
VHITDILLHKGRVSITSMKSRAHHFRPVQWAAVILLALLAISALSAQAPRVAFTVSTFTDLTHPEPAGQIIQDFNQDGHLDLLVTTKLFTGDGTGFLAAAGGFFYAFPSAVATADFNADGYPDVVVTQDLASKQSFYGDICGSTIGIGLFLGPSFSSSRCIATMQRVIAVQTADFNGDAKPEIAVVSASTSGLWIYSGDYFDSPFSVQITTVSGANVQASSMAPPVDLNRDGTLDLIVGYNGGVKTFLGNGDGTFTASASVSATPAGASATVVAAGPLNADGYPDIAWVESGSNGRLLVGLGAANNTFSVQSVATVTTPSPGLADVSIADVDHDGRHDVVVADKGNGLIRIYFGSGDGTFADNRALALSVKPKQLAVADWDKDGDNDLVIVDSGVGGLNAIAWTARQDRSGPTDTTPPAVALTAPALNASVAGRIAVAAAASDNNGVTHVDFYKGGKLIAKSAGPNFIISWDTTSAPNGAATLTAWAYDAAGNVTTSSAVQVTVANDGSSDTAPPIVTVPAAITAEATGPGGAIVTYAASASDNVDGNIAPTCNPASGSTFPLYHTTVTCTATDAHGNIGSESFTVTVRDTAPPAVSVPDNSIVEATSANGVAYTFSASAADIVDGVVPATCTPVSGATFAFGPTTVQCTATDAHGNAGSASFTVTVHDTTAPVVTVPENATTEATGASGATYGFNASAVDNIDGDVPTTCTPANGATFALGTTTVTCSASDAHGKT